MLTSTHTHIRTRRSLEILGDTKRQVENTVESLRYAGVINDNCQVVSKRNKAMGLHVATVTLNYSLDNATIAKIRSW